MVIPAFSEAKEMVVTAPSEAKQVSRAATFGEAKKVVVTSSFGEAKKVVITSSFGEDVVII